MKEMWELEVEVSGLPAQWCQQLALKFGIETLGPLVPLVLHQPYGLLRLVPGGEVAARVVHRCAECGQEFKTHEGG